MVRKTWISVASASLVISALAGAVDAQQAVEVPPDRAQQNLVQQVPPAYPVVARMGGIQGKVVLRVRIAKDGSVAEIKLIRGHPLLAAAALQAVNQWKYSPFTSDGKPVEATTTVEVTFSLGNPEAQAKRQKEIDEAYLKKIDQCRSLLSAREYRQAEATCNTAAEIAEKLPPERAAERIDAYEYLGYSLFEQQKFKRSLKYFRIEVNLAEKSLHPDDAELGHAYHAMAQGLNANGDVSGARDYYERSIKTLDLASEHIQSDAQKAEYEKTVKKILQEYAQVLRQSGDAIAAAAAEQRANSLP